MLAIEWMNQAKAQGFNRVTVELCPVSHQWVVRGERHHGPAVEVHDAVVETAMMRLLTDFPTPER